jgi:uncharacterized repeat protein (TIGR01451 family)
MPRTARPFSILVALSLCAAGLLPSCGRTPLPTDRVEHTITLSDDQGRALDISREVPREVHVGSEIEYRLRVHNASDHAVTGILLRERLPEGFEVLDARIARGVGDEEPGRGRPVEAGAPRGPQSAALDGTGELILRLERLEPGEWALLAVEGIARSEGQVQSQTIVTYEAALDMTWNIVRPELRLELLAEPTAWICEDIQLVHRLGNEGTGTAGAGQIQTRLPEGLRTSDGAAEVVLAFGPLEPGAHHEETVLLRAERTGEFQVQGLAATDRLQVRSQTRILSVVAPRLQLRLGRADQVAFGTSNTVEVLVVNTGDITVPDVALRVESTRGVAATLVGERTERAEQLELGDLAPGAQRRATLQLVPESAGEPFEVVVVATAYCLQAERALRERLSGTAAGIAALRVEILDEPDPLAVGQTTTYRVAITNQGSGDDHGVEVLMRLSPELTFVGGTGASTVSVDAGLIRFGGLATLRAGETAEWRVEVRGVAPGRARAAIQVRSASSPDPVLAEEPTTVVR